jgi:hypothetical protein
MAESSPKPGTTPDEVWQRDGEDVARWGQDVVVPTGTEWEPIPRVYSSGWNGGELEFGSDTTWRLSLDEAEAFITRLQNAIAYERAQGGGSR